MVRFAIVVQGTPTLVYSSTNGLFPPPAPNWTKKVTDSPKVIIPCERVSEIAAGETTVIAALVFAVFVPSVRSVAVTVRLPTVLRVTLNVLVPATRAALAGRVAAGSLEVIPTVWIELTTFQLASTALTITVNGGPDALGGRGARLPGRRARSGGLAGDEHLELGERTRVDGDRSAGARGLRGVGDVRRGDVRVPAVLRVTLNVFVPATRAAFAGRVALASLEVIPTVWVELTTSSSRPPR